MKVRSRSGGSETAPASYSESLALRAVIGDHWGEVDDLVGIAHLAAPCGRMLDASNLLATAHARAGELDYTVSAIAALQYLQRRLPQDVTIDARYEGTCLTFDQAVALAQDVIEAARAELPSREGRSPRPRPTSVCIQPAEPRPFTPRSTNTLTRREREVLGLLCQRLTDREIADQIFVSPHTVGKHVSNVLGKLGVANRREAAAIVARFGLS